MKSLFKRLKKRKGFTLVECIVAIAVFAAFCLMVMLIVAGAQKESKLAYDTETELNGLVENVMDDDVYRSFSATHSTKSLEMSFTGSSSGNFSITYDIVDGHKNHVLCTGCGYFGNNTEFMGGTSSKNFQPWTKNYVCPECGKTLMGSDVELKCGDCGRSAYYTVCDKEYNSTKAWTYESGSGSFVCNACGSANVTALNIEEKKFENSYVSVSGMTANSIRYGTVAPPSKESVIVVSDDTGVVNDSSKATVNVNYDGTATNPNNVGTYTISLSGIGKPADPDTTDDVVPQTKILIAIPNGYYIEDLKCNGSSSLPDNLSYIQPDYEQDKTGSLTWTTTGTGTTASNVTISFKLRNYKTGFSFDYDYQNVTRESDKKVVTGLAAYWFGLTGNGGSTQWPITS